MQNSNKPAEILVGLQQGELSATETYQQALDKVGDTPWAPELRQIHSEHREAANTLRNHVRDHGGTPAQSSGAWGTWAKAVEGTAKIMGKKPALTALKMGEEHGVKHYEKVLTDSQLPPECVELIRSTLLPQTRSHIQALDRLMAND